MNKNLLTTVSTSLATAALVLFLTDGDSAAPAQPETSPKTQAPTARVATPAAPQAPRKTKQAEDPQALLQAMQALAAEDQRLFDDAFADAFGDLDESGMQDFDLEAFASLFESEFGADGFGGGGFQGQTYDAATMQQAVGEWQAMLETWGAAMSDWNAMGNTGYAGGDSTFGWANPPSKQSFYANEGQNGFYANNNLGTAVSTSGDSGYIALGNGQFVSW